MTTTAGMFLIGPFTIALIVAYFTGRRSGRKDGYKHGYAVGKVDGELEESNRNSEARMRRMAERGRKTLSVDGALGNARMLKRKF